MPKITYRCPTCGSANVGWDANAHWDDERQEHVLADIFPCNAWCGDCEAETGDPLKVDLDEVAK